jgi:hypothetical protein
MEVHVPLLRSSFCDRNHGGELQVKWELWYDNMGVRVVADSGHIPVKWDGFGVAPLSSLNVTMPRQDAVAILAICLVSEKDEILTRNFITFDVRSGKDGGVYRGEGDFISIPVGAFSEQTFEHQWEAIQGEKVNGIGEGHYVFEVSLPDSTDKKMIGEIEIMFEASAKRVLARNVEEARFNEMGIGAMHGADAKVEYNPNTYYMTDDERHPSRVNVLVEGKRIGSFDLSDDPADSRGVLSWHYQAVANKLDEAGSYGYLCKVNVPGQLASKLDCNRSFRLELQAEEGGIALYGRNAGRYPINLLIRYN